MNSTNLDNIPYENTFNIVLKLDYHDIINYCLVNKNMSRICQDYYFWKLKSKHDFNVDLEYFKILFPNDSPSKLYYNLLILEKALDEKGTKYINDIFDLVKIGLYHPKFLDGLFLMAITEDNVEIVLYLVENTNILNFINLVDSLILSIKYGSYDVSNYLINYNKQLIKMVPTSELNNLITQICLINCSYPDDMRVVKFLRSLRSSFRN